jgi:hypothetical protein
VAGFFCFRREVGDYYSTMGDELIFNPATDEIGDIERLAEIVL